MHCIPGEVQVVMFLHRSRAPNIDANGIWSFHCCRKLTEAQGRGTEPRHPCLFSKARDFTCVLQRRGERLVNEQRLPPGYHFLCLREVNSSIPAFKENGIYSCTKRSNSGDDLDTKIGRAS